MRNWGYLTKDTIIKHFDSDIFKQYVAIGKKLDRATECFDFAISTACLYPKLMQKKKTRQCLEEVEDTVLEILDDLVELKTMLIKKGFV